MLKILIEKVAEVLVDALNNKILKILTILSLFPCFGILFFILLNFILPNLILLGVPHSYILSYGLY
jgi:hypothetical protein